MGAARAGVQSRKRLKRVLIDQKVIENFQSLEKCINETEEVLKEETAINPAIPYNFGKISIIYKNLAELLRVFE